jgi:hypothetical protein
MSRKLLISILALLGILSLVVILKTPLAGKAMARFLPNLRTTEERFDPYKDEIAIMEKELQRTDLSSEERQFLLDKFSSEFLSATQRAKGLENRPTRPAFIIATPTNDTGGYKIPDGIDDHPSVPISESVVTVINSWRKTTEGRYFLVFAGVLTTDSKQGAILILHTNYRFYQYNTPTKNGGVKVIAENGTVITLQSTDGTIFYFDASQETFIDENGKPIPVNTIASPTSSNLSESTQATLPAYP